MTRPQRRAAAAVFAIALAAVALARLPHPAEKGSPGAAPSAAQDGAATDAGAAALQPVQAADGAALDPAQGLPISEAPDEQDPPIVTPAAPPPTATPPRADLADPQASAGGSQQPSAAGPRVVVPDGPVSYTDEGNDASGPVANPTASQSAFDILRVEWAPVSRVEEAAAGYSTSITIAGTAHEDGAYVSYGNFRSGGMDCQLFNVMAPGAIAFANAFCGSVEDGTRRFLGSLDGGPVTATSTATGGTLLTATFDDPTIPPELEAAGRRLFTLSAFTCLGREDALCLWADMLDYATSSRTYRV
jgi:hypothetical protein